MNLQSNPLFRPRQLTSSAIALAFTALVTVTQVPAGAQPASAPPASSPAKSTRPAVARQPSFASPEAGFEALITTLRAKDAKQLARLLGPGHERIVDSGDNAADREVWAKFVAAYDAKHAVQMQDDAKAMLTTGTDDWPMPIPIVKRADGWVFDADAGEEEVIARRIGRNELDAMKVCLAFIDMQREYAEADRDGDGQLQYAGRLVSSPGKRDGLYWPTKEGEPPSPAGPRLAEAAPKLNAQGKAVPYHGYYYRILTAQGKNAPGGARSYRVNGKLIGGVALVAYPASYLSSGVKTFTCNLDGIVYEKDLGTGTAAQASKITAYDPDPSWTRSK